MAYSRTNALGTYVLQVLETGRWSLSVLEGHLGSSTSSWLKGIFIRKRTSGAAANSKKFRELTRVLLLKSSSHSSSVSRYSQRRQPLDASNYREAISEARAEMLSKALHEAGNPDANDADELESMAGSLLEFVVYTAILERAPGSDMVVVLSTDRVVVAGYKRTSSDSHIKSIWQCRLAQSRAPLLNTSGASSVLTLRAKAEDKHLQSAQSAKTEFEIRREHNDYKLINLYNVLNALLGNFEYLFNPQPLGVQNSEVYYDVDSETLHIGPWAYAKEIDYFEEDSAGALGGQQLKDRLEKAPWLSTESGSGCQDAPEWLEEECQAAVSSHEHIVEISAMQGDTKGECMLLDGLRAGYVSLDEFRRSRSASAADVLDEESASNNRQSMRVQFVVEDTAQPEVPDFTETVLDSAPSEDLKELSESSVGDRSQRREDGDAVEVVSESSPKLLSGELVETFSRRQEEVERRMERLEGLVMQLLAQHLPSERDRTTDSSGKTSPRR